MRETKNYDTEHVTFGGYVYDYDFNGYNSIVEIAGRIASDMKFDESCKKNKVGTKGKING